MVPVGTMGPFWPGDGLGCPFPGSVCVCVCVCVCGVGGGEGLWAVSKVDNSARAPRLPRFILLKSFSDTLLVVSILDRVFDCHL